MIKLEQENSELRILKNEKVISTNYDHFNHRIYKLLLERIKNSTNEWASKNRSFFFKK